MKETDWFTSWFNTPYYHILYKDRNDKDAQVFMRNITSFLQLPKGSHIADIPCGKGRHSVYLNSLGYNVTGGDLSENSIAYAKQYENETLRFAVKDMREPLKNKYDAIFNLFTSFGYIEDDAEDILILKNLKNGLKKDGVLVLDFLNVEKVRKTIVTNEVKIVDGIIFSIQREIVNGFIKKHISFEVDGESHAYTEHVKYIDLEKMKIYFSEAGLQIDHVFGDYDLNPFDGTTSNRLILVAS
ncbi:class I SAM-dependent methyltransferase [Flavobacteriaceae bacterium S356]|uniref:Class I SAM-dependent methyltransferase n=1 Tax=Asprobacillus argus TaxID=3076534 RepID=A0ABU3LDW3_9FLAO|nr:class I SAM-dependent methyltransferase [Flavobacteriaceae bacterium S356]